MVERELFPPPPPQAPSSSSHARPAPSGPLNETVNEVANRLAVLEERVANLRKKTQVTEQSLIEYDQETRTDLKALAERVTELARKVEDVHEKIEAMSGELGTVVKKNDLAVLERYLDLWQPMSFVTRDEAKLLIKDAQERSGRYPQPPLGATPPVAKAPVTKPSPKAERR